MISTTQSLADQVRADFPILQRQVNGKPLIYFDNAETSQKPSVVLDTLREYYEQYNANPHRSRHAIAQQATAAYEAARQKIASYVNAASPQEIIFTRNATESINLVAYTWGMNNLSSGDEIILSIMEHHSNLVPWQEVAQKTGAVLKYVELNDAEEFNLDQFKTLLSDRTKLVTVVHVSNMLGCINPVQEITAIAQQHGAKVLIDACQSIPHLPVDVQSLNCDWLVASGHKMGAPMGIGFLYGKSDLLQSLPPFMTGGNMSGEVFRNHSTFKELPFKFEAGTPSTADAIAYGTAVDYLSEIGSDRIAAYELELTKYLYQRLQQIPSVRIYGPAPEAATIGRVAIVTFSTEKIPAQDLATHLDQAGIAITAGFHATKPLHEYLGIQATARASLYFYNTRTEIDRFIAVFKQVID